ncbi:MAG: glycosyltransferase family 2 protein [Candidatus Hydrogenedentes bacterium]|nr:glycosyltransferase family 2 protein [Candidatus Hydrogenedentota bacterium]
MSGEQVGARDMAQSGDPSLRRTLAVLVPCYNAGERVRPVIEAALARVDHVVVVDDGSTDGAAAALADLPIRLVTFPENRGKGFAILEGFRAALSVPGVSGVAIIDADGQHDPGELPGLYKTFVDTGADLVIGSRTFDLAHVPWRSRFGNKLTAVLTRLLLKQPIPDTQSGYRIHSRRLLEDLLPSLRGGRYETETELLVRAVREGYCVVSSPIATIYEEGNPSSHFGKLRDPFRIYRRLFVTALRRSRRRATRD